LCLEAKFLEIEFDVTTSWKSVAIEKKQEKARITAAKRFVEPVAEPKEPPTFKQKVTVLGAKEEGVSVPKHRTNWAIGVAEDGGKTKASGGDIMNLEDGAFLEMFEVLLDGKPANIPLLRYCRPGFAIIPLPVEEMLEKQAV
jgi:hypothetical protein